MKVILLEDVKNIGKKYEVKEVKPGYARNFLIPNNLAKVATKKNVMWLETQKETLEKQAEEDLKIVQKLASELDGIEVIIPVKIGPEGQLFESINNIKISERLKEMGFTIKKSQIDLQEPIKKLGEFPLKINLDHNLETEITVMVVAEKELEEEKET